MKEEKANDQIIFSMIQDISALFNGEDFRNSASTASIAESDIQRDGADKSDIQHVLENNVFDKFGDIPGKILHNLQEYPEILKELSENYDPEEVQDIVDNMSYDPDALYAFGEMLTDYLQNVKKYAKGGQFENNKNETDIYIGKKTFHVLIFKTEKEMKTGLMNVEYMDDDEGGLFIYEKPQDVEFWMKDTTIPLDIIFIGPDKKIISIKKGEPESEKLIPESNVQYVLEVNQNSGLKPGQKLEFDDDEFEESEHPELDTNKLYVIGSDGKPQMELVGGERIISIKETKTLINKAKRAFYEKSDSAYKSLGKYLFKIFDGQDSRPSEYVKQ